MKSKLIIGCMLLGALSAKAQVQPITAAEYKEKVLEYSRQIKQSSEAYPESLYPRPSLQERYVSWSPR